MLLNLILSMVLTAGAAVTSPLSEGFSNPPAEKCSHVIWGWEGKLDKEVICHDLDSIKATGFKAVIIEAGYGLPFEYLSEGWFEMIRTAVKEASKRGLKVRVIDEGKYPSGFAGGKFTREKPEMRMKALVVLDTLHAGRGEILRGVSVDSRVFSAVAVCRGDALDRPVPVKDGRIDFYAGSDEWDILLVGWDYRTGDTRAVNNPRRVKDKKNSQSDYLSAAAARQFIDWTHEQYKKYIGDEFGRTMLGFRGDESDFGRLPWTPDFPEQFESRKGYDLRPFIAGVFGFRQSAEMRKVRADYFDVWSELFADNFFGQQAQWCEENGLEFITHLNKDHDMPECVRVSGDFFRTLNRIQVPGVDAIWNQIWPGTVNDFPKFASSVSHVYGKERAFSESFAAYNIPPTMPTAEYALNYQMVRGINYFELMFWMSGSKLRTWMTDPGMKPLNDWLNRTGWMMQQGRPGARIAVYYPTSTLWLGDRAVNPDLVEISQILLNHQRDFDWVDDDAFTEALEVRDGGLVNLSGQKYSTLVIPSCEMISQEAWKVIDSFARSGGKVLFWGRRPSALYGSTFTQTVPVPALCRPSFEEPSVSWTGVAAAAMPAPEFSTDVPAPGVTYAHRSGDGFETYLVFNEGELERSFTATFDGVGIVRSWDGRSGTSAIVEAEKCGATTKMKMTLAPWESRLITIERAEREYNVRKLGIRPGSEPQTSALQAVIDRVYADGGGTVVIPSGEYVSGALFFPEGVNLRVDRKAVLKATADPADYPVIPTRFEGTDRKWRCAFLNFNGRGVRVYGEGVIDGNGLEWNKIRVPDGRPRLLCFNGCDGGSISGLHLRNQAFWCLHLLYTHGFDIKGLDIVAKEYIPSSDGMDIDSSTGVHISDCYISVHDDCISIKSGKDAEGRRVARPSEDILIENCHFGYGHGGVVMGSEISGDIRRVTARNCVADEDNWEPIRFKSQPPRGGVVEDITFENFEISGVRNAIYVNMDWRSSSDSHKVYEYADPVSRLRNITIRNVHGDAKSMGCFRGYSFEPIGPEVFKFENCSFKAEKGLEIRDAEINLDGLEFTVTEGEKIIRK